jgi:alkanesulfonate monooxygenase SsuD/methylene tetrahydromethanopterin reductase-like flavin-dependent oxidoreductase (luciferase family)
MRLGMFGQPFHPPGKSPYDCQEWDLQVIRWLDELGYEEAWFGEHHTLPWEPNPAPDILIAQAFRETRRIRLGPGGICLPYHNPAVVANRMAWLDHLSQGRLNFGVAAGAIPTDWKLLGIDGASTRDMTRESLEIIQRIWSGERPFVHAGTYWRIEVEAPRPPLFDAHIRPLQKPGPPIGVSGLSPNSPTLRIAGTMGYLPMSLSADLGSLRSHWDTYAEAAVKAGRTPHRADWRVCKEVIVAETDAAAMALATEGGLGEFQREYGARMGPVFREIQGLPPVHVPPETLTAQHQATHNWIVGSPATVREKLEQYQHASGGFGTLLVFACDYAHRPEAWRASLQLLAEEVAPKVAAPSRSEPAHV